ncbi:Putative phage abortive infection protein [Flavobacterium fluvii]|uniref:Putative phage abortive infection protein n=1 Tax=Flavobacterium fluvii TaxID=468056 RepID=A0A1M5JQD5_9FLAO|nr:putative phage abortive infection protein [Flavobacterium fluvii]SHG42792.1 Putative phage abortive infection protein [Flavobacterium fluvii]
MDKNDKKFKPSNDSIIWIFLILALIILIFSCVAPSFFVKVAKNQDLDFTKTGNIGDTIGGLMNPFVAIAGILVTFLAFYIQFSFNKFQINLFKHQWDDTQNKYEKDKFENQFYEMLRLHKENVNEMSLTTKKIIIHPNTNREIVENIVSGRRVFEYIINEFELILIVALASFKDENLDNQKIINEAYGVLFHGLHSFDINKHVFYQNLKKLQSNIYNLDYEEFNKSLTNITGVVTVSLAQRIDYSIFNGYSSQLAHYYRHLYQTVKFVVSQPEKKVNYEEKRNLLRILRAQLSNLEQALLFYNWYSGFGKQWQDNNNNFFTDYRMIHNVYNDLLHLDIKLEDIFDYNNNYKKEKNRENDSLFESQDW